MPETVWNKSLKLHKVKWFHSGLIQLYLPQFTLFTFCGSNFNVRHKYPQRNTDSYLYLITFNNSINSDLHFITNSIFHKKYKKNLMFLTARYKRKWYTFSHLLFHLGKQHRENTTMNDGWIEMSCFTLIKHLGTESMWKLLVMQNTKR